jgi:hypothetical protein
MKVVASNSEAIYSLLEKELRAFRAAVAGFGVPNN